MNNLNEINVKELSLESKILISGGDTGDSAEVLGYIFGWITGTVEQLLDEVNNAILSVGVQNPGAGGYTGSKL